MLFKKVMFCNVYSCTGSVAFHFLQLGYQWGTALPEEKPNMYPLLLDSERIALVCGCMKLTEMFSSSDVSMIDSSHHFSSYIQDTFLCPKSSSLLLRLEGNVFSTCLQTSSWFAEFSQQLECTVVTTDANYRFHFKLAPFQLRILLKYILT